MSVTKSAGPTLPLSERTHARKYRAAGETFRESVWRQAGALSDSPQHRTQYADILMDMRFLPAGRVQKGAGSPDRVTCYNCFVAPTLLDSFVHGADGELGGDSIMGVATQAAATMRMGGGIGYDFSTLRPKGELIKKLRSRSSGPISFMRIFNEVCLCTASTDNRRGAEMGVMRVDHPDIEEFVHVKQQAGVLTGFNLSVGITDKFMQCLAAGRPFPLEWGGRVYREVDTAALWDAIMRSTWDWAEPGVLFIDRMNDMNNLWYVERIAATNPCGEQPLPPHGACLLGSFNVAAYVSTDERDQYSIDIDQLAADVAPVVRAMDNVVDHSLYPLPEQAAEARSKRRMGLGVTGLANALEACGMPYGTPEFQHAEEAVLTVIRDRAYEASVQLAQEKGAFALFDADLYCKSKFVRTLPPELQRDIFKSGIRNSHLTSIAPTGTISLCADNVSSGIEPVFAYDYERTVLEDGGPQTYHMTDYGVAHFGVRGVTADRVTARQHVDVLCAAARLVDSAVSKTCNVGPEVDWAGFKQIYVDAYEGGAKGCTTFRADGRRSGVLVAKEDEGQQPDSVATSCEIDPMSGRRSCE